MDDLIKKLYYPKFHAIHFTYKGIQYVFSGWWLLEWDGNYREYADIESFLTDNIFEERSFKDIIPFLSNIDFEFEA